MQLTQFATFFIHATFPLFIDCDFPKYYSYIILFHGAMFFAMFTNFYVKAKIFQSQKYFNLIKNIWLQAYVKKGREKSHINGATNGHVKKLEWFIISSLKYIP